MSPNESGLPLRSRFQGVTTTGIYCRAGCPGTPLPVHTRPFEEAAAAEASGFRPCLRCRPDRLPGPSSWVSPSELVCRALRLIADGALDANASEEELGQRLGVSARHLRRLFESYVGATPSVVARSRRAHLARRLLDETDLPFSEVGFAAGFASVRQMNRVMKEVFHFTPSELRARRRRSDRLVADGGLDLRLPYHPPLAWEAITDFLGSRAIPGVESFEDGVYRRTVRIEGHAGVIEVTNLASENALKLRVHLPAFGSLADVVAGARRLFDLDADPEVITAQLSRDPTLRSLMKRLPGVRVPGTWDRFEIAVRAILGLTGNGAGSEDARRKAC